MLPKTVMLLILALLWVAVVFNRRLKHLIRQNEQQFKPAGKRANWGRPDCPCGMPRGKWKALAMNRPDNTVLLVCPQCGTFWEEQMSLYGNSWRPVDETYAHRTYDYGP